MKIFLNILGWLLKVCGILIYFLVWLKAYKYVADKIGSFFAIIILLFTNVIGPFIYTIWHWISDGFPIIYFIIWMLAIVLFIIGNLLTRLSDD